MIRKCFLNIYFIDQQYLPMVSDLDLEKLNSDNAIETAICNTSIKVICIFIEKNNKNHLCSFHLVRLDIILGIAFH